MDAQRFSTLAHAHHVLCNPLGSASVDAAIASLALPAGARVLDVGCGKGEMLLRTCERWNAIGVGVDPNGGFLAEARARAAARVAPGAVEWLEASIAEAALAPARFDAALCVGASHAFGTLAEALPALRALVRPGGSLLLGEGFWEREPSPEYLAGLGATRDEMDRHDALVERLRAAGWEPLAEWPTSLAEWDAYEGLYHEAIERFAVAHPADPDHDALLERSRRWWSLYQHHGRGTMGFTLLRLRRA